MLILLFGELGVRDGGIAGPFLTFGRA